jgi:hypothetical protein
MTAPPESAPGFNEAEFLRGMEQIKAALAAAPEAAREEAVQAFDSEEVIKRVANIVLPLMDQQYRRKYYPRIICAVGVLLLLFGGCIAFLFLKFGSLDQANTNQDAAIQRSNQTISAFQDQLRQANDQLVRLGLPPVDAPVDPAPGTPEQAQLINAAATATTLQKLASVQAVARPSQQDIAQAAAQALAEYIRANQQVAQPALNPQAVSDGVAQYLQRNGLPPGAAGPAGPGGPAGPPGPAPTADEIMTAFGQAVAANPQLLCPAGGQYGLQNVLVVGGGSVQQYGCFGATTAAQDTPGTDGNPGTGSGGGGNQPPTVDNPPPPDPGPGTGLQNDPLPNPPTTTEPPVPTTENGIGI